jgi:propanol-preferring alcohol dehydrogenase
MFSSPFASSPECSSPLTSPLSSVPKGLDMVSLPLHSLIERNVHLTGNLMGGHEETLEVMEYIWTGRITPRITKVGLEEVPHQLQAMVHCQTIGTLVVSL